MYKIKGIIIATLILISTFNVSAQTGNFGIGYNVGVFTKSEGLDYVIQRYNETRSWLSDQMETPKTFRGMNYSMELFLGKKIVNFEWSGRKAMVSGRGVGSRGDQTRELLYKVNTWNLGLGRKIGSETSSPIGLYWGLDLSMNIIKTSTRIYDTGKDKPSFTKISNFDVNVGFGPFIQHVGRRFTTKIFYQVQMLKNDYWNVNYAINPSTYSADPYEKLEGKTSSLGVGLRYYLIKNKS